MSNPFNPNRRNIITAASAGISIAMLSSLEKAMATPANNRTGSIKDIEHIVILMQENRGFDHYFGNFPGVRGQGDPRPLKLRNGHSVWRQPSEQHNDGYVMPYWADSKTANAYVVDGADQGHHAATLIVNDGHYDQWGLSKQMHNRMAYYKASDLPFYHALAANFTILDAYHCSTLTQTYPNRLHLWTGCNGAGKVGGIPVLSNYGEDETPSANMDEDMPIKAYEWTTYAERLEKAGVSWKVYQEYDNFGDNILSVFKPFRPCDKNSNLYKRGRSWVSEHKEGVDRTRSDGVQLVEAFKKDVMADKLPQVSWIVTAAALSEHPRWTPADGENLTAKLIEALLSNPKVFAKTAFIINYDEAGGFYDHMLPPMPPASEADGYSGVDVTGEFKDYDADPHIGVKGKQPLGLGIRIPSMIISPWTRGGYVCSEVFDHTSTIKFIEKRFGVYEPNISDWRRAICGDLTSAFDFKTPNNKLADLKLPNTDDYKERLAYSAMQPSLKIPELQTAGGQVEGQMGLRPAPYRLRADAVTKNGNFFVTLANEGTSGAVFTIHDHAAYDISGPWRYTLDKGQSYKAGNWNLKDRDIYDLHIHGPNGFYRHFAGRTVSNDKPIQDPLEITFNEDYKTGAITIAIINKSDKNIEIELAMDDEYKVSGSEQQKITIILNPTKSANISYSLVNSSGWYSLKMSHNQSKNWLRHYAGHVETGKASKTDPGIGRMVL